MELVSIYFTMSDKSIQCSEIGFHAILFLEQEDYSIFLNIKGDY